MDTPSIDTPIGDIRRVRILFEKSREQEHLVHKDQVATLVAAIVRLHHSPGVNPHAIPGKGPARAVCIVAAPFRTFGPTWWSTPSLMPEDVDQGAVLFKADVDSVVLWADPDYAIANDTEVCALEDAERVWRMAA